MLDAKYIIENQKTFEEALRKRGSKISLEEIKRLEKERIKLIQKIEGLRAERNKLSKKKPTEKEIQKVKDLKSELKNLEPSLSTVEEDLKKLLWKVPNLIHPSVPEGFSEAQNKVLKEVGQPPKFDFAPQDHEEIAKRLDLIDFEKGAKVAGTKFYYLKNEAVLLEFALIKYAFDILAKEGFKFFLTPDLAKERIIDGIGFSPRGPQSDIYFVEGEDLGLVGTAEITLGGYHAGEVLDEKRLPLKYGGFSHCYRKEAGGYGKYSAGLYRVHQFSKVEMFVFCRPDESERTHEYLLDIEEKIFKGLGIPYRVTEACSGELAAAAYRRFDIEAWMPGREKGAYGEVTSTSNTTDYQVRRLNIKYRSAKGGLMDYVHTLNGTALATSRAIIAILENYQQKDGGVVIPKVLVPYMGIEKINPKS